MNRSRTTKTTTTMATKTTTWRGFVALALLGICGAAYGQQQEPGERYARILKDVDTTSRYNAVLEQQLQAQQAQIQSLEQQAASLDTVASEIQPLLQRMFDELQAFISSDIPFHAEKRSEGVRKLRDLMEQPTTPSSEKYRRLVEAYQIEMEYGRTMDHYRAALADGREADFVRLGRVTLMYRTIDGAESGYWDHDKKSWVADRNYERAIERALRIAKQEEAPDLIAVPVPAPRGERS